MKTLKLQNGDLVYENGTFVMLTDADALVQKIEHKLKLWLGEWFLEPEKGIDWLGLAEAKLLAENRTRTAIRNELLTEEHIQRIVKLSINQDRKTRTTGIDIKCDSDFGEVEVSA